MLGTLLLIPRNQAIGHPHDMNLQNRPLVVGAGPVRLGAALFLAKQGRPPRVIEMREEPSWESKALAVNPRTLEYLETMGITRRMLELGCAHLRSPVPPAGRTGWDPVLRRHPS